MPAVSSVTSLQGGLRINYMMGQAAYDDPGGKIAALISQITILQSNVTALVSAVVSANASGASFSATSIGIFANMAAISNFLST